MLVRGQHSALLSANSILLVKHTSFGPCRSNCQKTPFILALPQQLEQQIMEKINMSVKLYLVSNCKHTSEKPERNHVIALKLVLSGKHKTRSNLVEIIELD